MENIAPRYVIISPVKDEERHIPHTIRSVIEQTIKPALWVIVDDCSQDSTPEILKKFLSSVPFVRIVRNPERRARQPGSAVIRAFNQGYESIGLFDYEFIVKLDCDLSFEPDYFETILKRMSSDERSGIFSGVYCEKDRDGGWNDVVMPTYHASGACKFMRRSCFEEIGGFVLAAGWDTVDEIRAMSRGWKTGHFKDLRMKHYKPEGSGIGAVRTSIMQGEVFYLTGGSLLFFFFKVLHRITAKPYVLCSLGMVRGFLRSFIQRKKLLVTPVEAKYYKRLLRERVAGRVRALIVPN